MTICITGQNFKTPQFIHFLLKIMQFDLSFYFEIKAKNKQLKLLNKLWNEFIKQHLTRVW